MFRLNLVNENPGRARVKLTQEQTNLPAAIQLISAKPEYVTVDLDQQARRQVKVTVPTRGKPPKGYVVTAIKALGPVYLVGPQEEISLHGTVNTESLSLAELSSSAERLLPVLAPSGKRFRVEPETIAVSVKIEQEESRVFPNVSLTVFKPALHAVTVKPTVAQIAVSGASATVRNLTLQEVSATLKLTDTLQKGKWRLPVEITLPPGVTLVKCEPALFDVEIK
jgi:YbbR domain-containing protein